jgi:hypothetical protein
MTNHITEIDDALSAALHALSAAQATLRKSLPGRSIDVLQKADLAEPRDVADIALAQLADADRRLERLEATSDLEAQYATRKTYARFDK